MISASWPVANPWVVYQQPSGSREELQVVSSVPSKGLYSPFKGNIQRVKEIVIFSLDFAFPTFAALDLKNNKFGLQIQILHEISSLEPAPKV